MLLFDLGLNLRELRKSKNWTQKRLSALLGISEASISKYESNIATPPIDTLRAYASLFNISLDELLGNQNKGNLSLQGLSDSQIEVLSQLAVTFKSANSENDCVSEDTYNVIGKVAMELYKVSDKIR